MVDTTEITSTSSKIRASYLKSFTDNKRKISPLTNKFNKSAKSPSLEPTTSTTKTENKLTVNPPFTALPSFMAASQILAFLDYEVDIKCLLKRLSHNTAKYYEAHGKILKGVLMPVPPPKLHPFFNDVKLSARVNDDVDFQFPEANSIMENKTFRDENVRVCTIVT